MAVKTESIKLAEIVTDAGTQTRCHTTDEHHPNANVIKDSTMKVVASCLRHFKDKNPISKVYANEDAYHWLVGTQRANERKIQEILNIK